MPKKDFSKDASEIFPFDVTKSAERQPYIQSDPIITRKEHDSINPPNDKQGKPHEKLVRATFYITEELEEILGIRSSKRGRPPEEKDRSSIVRTALKQYLGMQSIRCYISLNPRGVYACASRKIDQYITA
jgi:hypothetical protein